MAVHCKINTANQSYTFKNGGVLIPVRRATIEKQTTTTEKYVGDLRKSKNPQSDKGVNDSDKFDKIKKAAFFRNRLSILATNPALNTAECNIHRSKYYAKIAMFSLEPILNVPHINLDGELMACWSDVKEILFPGCSGTGCKIVLRSLEMKLKYPLLRKDIRSCSATERAKFIKSFHCVRQGVTLVNLRLVKRHWDSLVEMVAKKHQVSKDATSVDCCCKEGNDSDKSLDILCDVECDSGSCYYHGTDCSVEILSVQKEDKIVHPVPGFITRDQCGQKEIYVPLVTLLSTYPDLSLWLRATLGQLAEKCVRTPASQRWLNKPLIVFCSKRQGQMISHLMDKHGCSGPHITSRTMLVKWSYLTKSYFAGKILTRFLEQNDDNNENLSSSSLMKSGSSCSVDPEASAPKADEPTLPLRPIQNYQEQLWDYQKLKHQFYKQAAYRVTSGNKLQALGPQPESRAEVINDVGESATLALRKKWMASLGKYGHEGVIPLCRAGLECCAISYQKKRPLSERRKMRLYKHDPEKENDANVLASSNPRIHHSEQETANFTDLTSDKRHRPCKGKIQSFHSCYEDGDKPHDPLERSCPRSQSSQDVHSSSSRSRDVIACESRRATSEHVEKVDECKAFERGTRKIGTQGSDCRGRNSGCKENEREHNSECNPCRASGEQVTKHRANLRKGQVLFSGKKEGKSLDAEQEISSLGMCRDRELNKIVQIGNKGVNHGNSRSCQDYSKEVKLIQELEPSGDTNSKMLNGNNVENKDDDENGDLSVAIANSDAKNIININNNSNYNIKNDADVYPTSRHTKDNVTSKTSSDNGVSLNSQKIKNMDKKTDGLYANEQRYGISCGYKNKVKIRDKARGFVTVPNVKVFQSPNSDLIETALDEQSDESLLERRETLLIPCGPKDIAIDDELLIGSQTDKNQENVGQEMHSLKTDSKSGQVDGKLKTKDRVTALLLTTQQHEGKENPHSFENVVSQSAQPQFVNLRPLKKNILMRESARKESLEENRKLPCSCQDLHIAFEPFSLQKHFKKSKVHCSNCIVQTTPLGQVKQDRDANQASVSTNNAEIGSNASHNKPMSPARFTGTLTPSAPPLISAEKLTNPRHPKKALLDNYLREVRETLNADEVSLREQGLQTALSLGSTAVPTEEARQESPANEIPDERVSFELQLNMASLTASTSQSMLDELGDAPSSDRGVGEFNNQPEKDIRSRLSVLFDERNPTIDSDAQQYSENHESGSEFPFAFRLECFYDSESRRMGYIHRQSPAISVPYIMIGSVEFITVRSALKLFSEFDENCFVKCFLRDDKKAVCQTTCSQDQATLLRKINTLPDVQATEGEDLVQIGPLIYNFHRFKETMRRLRIHNKQTAQIQSHNSEDR